MRDVTNTNRTVKAFVFILLTIALLGILLYGYYSLQIIEYKKYVNTSAKNIIRQSILFPIRGDILARDSTILVDNRPAFSLYVSPRIIRKDTSIIAKLRDLVQDPTIKYKRIYRRLYAKSERVLLKRHISKKLMTKLNENRPFLNGVYIKNDSRRNHTKLINGAHIIGYVGEITNKELKKETKFAAGDIIGKSGIEKSFNQQLYGKKGLVSQVFDAMGNRVSDLGKEMEFLIPAIDGLDLYTTIDKKLQLVAESLLINNIGSIVAMNTRTGGIFAMASSPTYKPGLMSKTISNRVWNALLDKKNKNPLLNRSLQGQYPPGSTYKMVAAITALKEKLISSQWTVVCEGKMNIGRKVIHCWNHKGHGKVNMKKAIQVSCNIYFYNLGLKIGLEKWEHYSKAFGFGSKTNIDIPLEKSGLVPSVAYYKKRYPGGHKPGHLAILAIGQGELLVTPIQMAQFMAILANKGEYFEPHFLYGISPKYKKQISLFIPKQKHIPINFTKKQWQIIRKGMKAAVNAKYGATAWRAKLTNIVVAGKTGTAQVPPKKAHSWFTGFAPFDKPEIAIAVLIENGGSGAGVATQSARALFEQYFYGFVKPVIYKKKPFIDIKIEIPDLIVPTVIEEIKFERED